MTESRPPFPSGPLNAAPDAFQAACVHEWPPEASALVNRTLAHLARAGVQPAPPEVRLPRPMD